MDAMCAPDSPSPRTDRHKQSMWVVEAPVCAFVVVGSMHSYMLPCGLQALLTAATALAHTSNVRYETCRVLAKVVHSEIYAMLFQPRRRGLANGVADRKQQRVKRSQRHQVHTHRAQGGGEIRQFNNVVGIEAIALYLASVQSADVGGVHDFILRACTMNKSTDLHLERRA